MCLCLSHSCVCCGISDHVLFTLGWAYSWCPECLLVLTEWLPTCSGYWRIGRLNKMKEFWYRVVRRTEVLQTGSKTAGRKFEKADTSVIPSEPWLTVTQWERRAQTLVCPHRSVAPWEMCRLSWVNTGRAARVRAARVTLLLEVWERGMEGGDRSLNRVNKNGNWVLLLWHSLLWL